MKAIDSECRSSLVSVSVSVLVLMAFSVLPAALANDEIPNLAMGFGEIGPFESNKHVFSFASLDSTPTVSRVNLEGDDYLEYTFRFEGHTVEAQLDLSDTLVYKLFTKDAVFSTSKGSRVGHTLKQLVEDNPESFIVLADHGALAFGLVLPEDEGVFTFEVDEDTLYVCHLSLQTCIEKHGSMVSTEFFTYKFD